MLGQDLRAERTRKLQRQLALKRVARDYMRHAMNSGMGPAEAMRWAPPDVQAGLGLIRREEKQAQRDQLHQKKERLADRFNIQSPRA